MKKLLFVFVVLLAFIACCTGKEKMDSSKFDQKIISITSMELIDKLNIDEQATINEYKNHRIQMTGIIAGGGFRLMTLPVVFDESGKQIFDNILITDTITFGKEEWGWQIFFDYDRIIKTGVINDKVYYNGDIVTIQGSLEGIERYRSVIAESLSYSMDESEIQYRVGMVIFVKDCTIIEVNGIPYSEYYSLSPLHELREYRKNTGYRERHAMPPQPATRAEWAEWVQSLIDAGVPVTEMNKTRQAQ